MSVDSWMDKVVVHIYNGILLSHFLKMNLSQWDGEGFPSGSAIKNLPAGDVSSTPGLGRSPRGWHDNPLQYSFLENFMDRGACWATVHGVAKSWTWLRQISMHAHSEVDEPRGYYTEWSKSEREKILYINVCAYIESWDSPFQSPRRRGSPAMASSALRAFKNGHVDMGACEINAQMQRAWR